MEFADVYNMTNDHGKNFLNMWFRKKEILGVEKRDDNCSRNEFTIIYRELNGGIFTAILPCADSKNDGSCFFGDFEYFNILYSLEKNGITPKWNPNGYVMWPVWYTTKESFEKFLGTYKEMRIKYS